MQHVHGGLGTTQPAAEATPWLRQSKPLGGTNIDHPWPFAWLCARSAWPRGAREPASHTQDPWAVMSSVILPLTCAALCVPRSIRLAVYSATLYSRGFLHYRCTHPVTDHLMLLRRIGLIGSFVFHSGAAKRSCAGFATPQAGRLFQRRPGASTRNRAALEMSSTSADQRTKVVAGIRELCEKYDGFILDQFGVLHGECSCVL